MSAIERFAAFAAGLHTDGVAVATLDKVRMHIFDTLVASIIGGASSEGQAIARLVQEIAGPGTEPAIGLGFKAPVSFAALAGTAATRCTEIDDIHLASCTTPGSVIIPALMAQSSSLASVEASTLLAATLVGYEGMVRFGLAVDGANMQHKGVWPTYLTSTVGAAIAAARLHGLSAEQSAHALGMALTLTSGTHGRTGEPTSRWLTLGCGVQNGILAALSARRGFRGDLTLLDGGWSKAMDIAVNLEKLLSGLGGVFAIDRVSIKPYCAAKQTTAAIYAFLGLLNDERLAPRDIERIVVAVPGRYFHMINQPTLPSDRTGTIASIQYLLSLAAYHRASLLDVQRTAIHADPDCRDLAAKVTVVEDESLGRYYPEFWPARVVVETPGGRFTREVHHTKGDPSNPISWEEVVQKAHAVTVAVVASTKIDRLAEACRGLGEKTSLAEMLAEIAMATSGAAVN